MNTLGPLRVVQALIPLLRKSDAGKVALQGAEESPLFLLSSPQKSRVVRPQARSPSAVNDAGGTYILNDVERPWVELVDLLQDLRYLRALHNGIDNVYRAFRPRETMIMRKVPMLTSVTRIKKIRIGVM